MIRSLLLSGATTCCIACQTYTAESVASLAPGSDIRVTLAPQGSTELANIVGIGAGTIEGKVVTNDATGVRLEAAGVQRTDGNTLRLYGKSILLPAGAVAVAEVKHTDVGRSLLAAGAVVGGALLVAHMGGGSGSTQSGPVSPVNPK